MKHNHKLLALLIIFTLFTSSIFAFPSYSVTSGNMTAVYYRPFISDLYTTGHTRLQVNSLIKTLEANSLIP